MSDLTGIDKEIAEAFEQEAKSEYGFYYLAASHFQKLSDLFHQRGVEIQAKWIKECENVKKVNQT